MTRRALRHLCEGMVWGITLFWAVLGLLQTGQPRVMLVLLPLLVFLVLFWEAAERREGLRRVSKQAVADLDTVWRERVGQPVAVQQLYGASYERGVEETLHNTLNNL
jgi:hypothetical protein